MCMILQFAWCKTSEMLKKEAIRLNHVAGGTITSVLIMLGYFFFFCCLSFFSALQIASVCSLLGLNVEDHECAG